MITNLRRVRDSNPRGALTPAALAVRCFRPLSQLSVVCGRGEAAPTTMRPRIPQYDHFFYMMYNILMKFLLALLLLFPAAFVVAQDTQEPSTTAGFVYGLWFDQETFFAGDEVTVSTAIFNSTGKDINGTVTFFLNNVAFDTKTFYLKKTENITTVQAKAIAPEGTVGFSVFISELSESQAGTATPRIVKYYKAEETRIIDTDTDGDNIGNKTDNDDDNDGITDFEESRAGSDPLDKTSTPATVAKDNEPETGAGSPDAPADDEKPEKDKTVIDRAKDTVSSEQVTGFVDGAGNFFTGTYEVFENTREFVEQGINGGGLSHMNRIDQKYGLTSSTTTARQSYSLWETKEYVLKPEVSWLDKTLAVLYSIGSFLFSSIWATGFFLLFIFWMLWKMFKTHSRGRSEGLW